MPVSTLSPEERLQRYMESIKKANRKYIETHKEIVNERQRNYYHTKLATNAEFVQKKREKAKAYYLKKKQENPENPILEEISR
jgi:hypothetical protein